MTTDPSIADPAQAIAIARQYIDARRYPRAEEVLRTALTVHPDSAYLLTELARTQIQMDQFVPAMHTAYAALSRAPDSTYAMRIYAIALDAVGRRQEGLSVAYRAVTDAPLDYLTHYTYASLLLNSHHARLALPVIDEALRLEPGDADLHLLRGRILRNLRRHKESTAAYHEALRIDPEAVAAVHNIAVNKLERGRWRGALRGLLDAARMDPNLGDLARKNIALTVRLPLRLVTALALVLAMFAASVAADMNDGQHVTTARVVLGAAIVVFVGVLVWLARRLTPKLWRSVFNAREFYYVRALVVVATVGYALVAVTGLLLPALMAMTPLLLFALVAVVFIGWFVGS